MIKRASVIAIALLVFAAQVAAAETLQGAVGQFPIRIVNDRPEYWQIRVWVFSGDALSERHGFLCQVLDWSYDAERVVGPADPSWGDHCNGYDSVTFWFEVNSPRFRMSNELMTFGSPAPWGATWRWNGAYWTCSGC